MADIAVKNCNAEVSIFGIMKEMLEVVESGLENVAKKADDTGKLKKIEADNYQSHDQSNKECLQLVSKPSSVETMAQNTSENLDSLEKSCGGVLDNSNRNGENVLALKRSSSSNGVDEQAQVLSCKTYFYPKKDSDNASVQEKSKSAIHELPAGVSLDDTEKKLLAGLSDFFLPITDNDYIPLSCPVLKSDEDAYLLSEEEKSFLRFLDDMKGLSTHANSVSAKCSKKRKWQPLFFTFPLPGLNNDERNLSNLSNPESFLQTKTQKKALSGRPFLQLMLSQDDNLPQAGEVCDGLRSEQNVFVNSSWNEKAEHVKEFCGYELEAPICEIVRNVNKQNDENSLKKVSEENMHQNLVLVAKQLQLSTFSNQGQSQSVPGKNQQDGLPKNSSVVGDVVSDANDSQSSYSVDNSKYCVPCDQPAEAPTLVSNETARGKTEQEGDACVYSEFQNVSETGTRKDAENDDQTTSFNSQIRAGEVHGCNDGFEIQDAKIGNDNHGDEELGNDLLVSCLEEGSSKRSDDQEFADNQDQFHQMLSTSSAGGNEDFGNHCNSQSQPHTSTLAEENIDSSSLAIENGRARNEEHIVIELLCEERAALDETDVQKVPSAELNEREKFPQDMKEFSQKRKELLQGRKEFPQNRKEFVQERTEFQQGRREFPQEQFYSRPIVSSSPSQQRLVHCDTDGHDNSMDVVCKDEIMDDPEEDHGVVPDQEDWVSGREVTIQSPAEQSFYDDPEEEKLKDRGLPGCSFKWKYRPSCDDDEVTVAPTPAGVMERTLGNIQPLPSTALCPRRMRLGLSRRQKVKRLHHNAN